MTKLDIINRMLGSCGELPISSLQASHSLLPAATLRLDTVLASVLSKGWWFNRENAKLVVQPSDSRVYVPGDTLSCRAPLGVVQRGRVLYDTANSRYEFTSPVYVKLIRRLPLDQIPEVAVSYIAARAVSEFQSDYDGDSEKTRLYRDNAEMARRELNAEETRQVRYVMGQDNPDLITLRNIMIFNKVRR